MEHLRGQRRQPRHPLVQPQGSSKAAAFHIRGSHPGRPLNWDYWYISVVHQPVVILKILAGDRSCAERRLGICFHDLGMNNLHDNVQNLASIH